WSNPISSTIIQTNEVNLWAEKELIKELLPQGSIESDTRIVFANALYFKGVWNDKFDASLTKKYKFHLLNDGLSALVEKVASKSNLLDNRLPYENVE
ncbi:hypothetical protein RYX36_013746, partial [Vicia faba]